MAGPGGRMMAGGGPDQRSIDFKGSSRRLIARFGPERLTTYALLACVVGAVFGLVNATLVDGRAPNGPHEVVLRCGEVDRPALQVPRGRYAADATVDHVSPAPARWPQ